MENRVEAKEAKGVITVFLSLSLLLILSLIMTIIEGARITTARIFTERSLMTAMDSVLAEFYVPLMEEYHILGLDAGYGSGSIKIDTMEDLMEDYISYTLSPSKQLKDSQKKRDIYDASLSAIEITGYTGVTDYHGDIFINQCVEYMKYKSLGNGLELLLENLSALDEPKKVSYIYKEKLKVEQELLEIDEGILMLMRLLDGVSTDRNGLKKKKDGSLKTEAEFVKMLYSASMTKEGVGINNEGIFQALQSKYVNPSTTFQEMREAIIKRKEAIERQERLDKEAESLAKSLQEASNAMALLQQQLEEAVAAHLDVSSLVNTIKASKEVVSEIRHQRDMVEKEISNCKEIKRVSRRVIEDGISHITCLISGVTPKLEDAKIAINSIIKTSAKADTLIDGYKDLLQEQKEELSKDIYEGLEEEVDNLSIYQSGNEHGFNLPNMLEILKSNGEVLQQAQEYVKASEQALDGEDSEKLVDYLSMAEKALNKYQTQGLTLDYSGVVLMSDEGENPLGAIQALIENGLMGLVIDTSILSKRELTEKELPSVLQAISSVEAHEISFVDFIKSLDIGKKQSEIGGIFQDFDYDISSTMTEGMNDIMEHVLFWAYIQEHFDSFTLKEAELKERKPSVLTYEQEYLLVGRDSDQENLSTIISKLIIFRIIMNFTSLLGDKTVMVEARKIATTLVGFTGLPVLVAITQTIIMVLLVFAESLVDTSALLMGKKVPLLKSKIQYRISELVNLNRTGIQSKAIAYPDQNKGISLSYQDYLKVFLFIKKKKELSFRSMDLIQENIRIRYEDSFTMSECLYGFDVKTSFDINYKFLCLPMLMEKTSNNVASHSVRLSQSY